MSSDYETLPTASLGYRTTLTKDRWSTTSLREYDGNRGEETPANGDAKTLPPVEVDEGCCTCNCFVQFLRGMMASLAVWLPGGCLLHVFRGGDPPVGLSLPFFVGAFLFGLVIYAYELRRRTTFWTVAWPNGTSHTTESFAREVRALREAAPLIELCAPGAAPTTYRIAEWRDETRPADPEGFAGAPRGLFVVLFPLEFYPGDPVEEAALEFARARVAGDAPCKGAGAEDVPPTYLPEGGPLYAKPDDVTIQINLKWPDGSISGNPPAMVIFLLGVVADFILNASLTPLLWPVRKRFFTLRGSHLGVVRFKVDAGGDVELDGSEPELREANDFWLREADWEALWSDVQSLGNRVAFLRRIRIAACFCTGMAAAAGVAGLAVTMLTDNPENKLLSKGCEVSITLAAAAFVVAGLAGFVAHRWAELCAQKFEERLQGLATCSASWSESWGPELLAITISQTPSGKDTATKLTTGGSVSVPLGSHDLSMGMLGGQDMSCHKDASQQYMYHPVNQTGFGSSVGYRSGSERELRPAKVSAPHPNLAIPMQGTHTDWR
eukprot:gnl/TRDRNA2_/TRDRNA2_168366_c0_seq1.p1 gnl/TRDRNA2_/TRDRNA2_168366_c0~~gnl/TRDRNA2_/TRDRNA2_168366_c0_seq1.p1  ORF type:complete len:552 (-),score=74.56 gnl/TRDRNA2_/TRDRNA2_168366_c0_seq1:76-1731(-)